VAKNRYLVFALLSLIMLVSLESFNELLSGVSEDTPGRQGADLRSQIAVVILWASLIALSFIPGVMRTPLRTKGIHWPAALLAWVVLSSLWTDDPVNGIPKAAVLLGTNLAVWRTASIVSTEKMFTCLFYNIAFMLVVSLILVIFVPSIGTVTHEWMHDGNWRGLFASKQGLGVVSAAFIGIAALRVVRRRKLFDVLMCGVALACLLGSASRGAGVVALVAVVCLVICRRHPRLAIVVAGVLLFDLALAIANICYFAATGNSSILLLGYDINFTERTFIWQYAIGNWSERPLLGFGLNGFWTNTDLFDSYRRLHGWVLDNYHSGYIAVVVETGVVGFILLAVVTWQLVRRLLYLMANARSQRLGLEMTISFFVMYFTINLTETFFLRSTNFVSVLFAFLVVKTLSVPDNALVRSISRVKRSSPQHAPISAPSA